jgi:hypothetical protein
LRFEFPACTISTLQLSIILVIAPCRKSLPQSAAIMMILNILMLLNFILAIEYFISHFDDNWRIAGEQAIIM